MKRHHVLGLALLAVFALSAIMAVSASAVVTLLAEWLDSGHKIEALTPVTSEGELLLEDTKVLIVGKVAIKCMGELDGSVGPNGEDEVTEVLNLAKELVSAAKPLLCNPQTACEETGESVPLVPVGLPWHTLLVLVEPSGYEDRIQQATAGYEVTCEADKIKSTDKCTAVLNSGGTLKNGTTDVLGEGSVSPNGNCSLGGNGSGVITVLGEELTSLTTGDLELSWE